MTGVTTIYQIYVDAFARGTSDRSEGRKHAVGCEPLRTVMGGEDIDHRAREQAGKDHACQRDGTGPHGEEAARRGGRR